jgi:phosphomannomutase / phosphoglucomutase
MWRTGHSLIKAKMKETGAALAGEMSGHIFFKDRWYGFDDAIYAAARLLEILSLEVDSADQVFAEFPPIFRRRNCTSTSPKTRKFRIIDGALQKIGRCSRAAELSTHRRCARRLPEFWGLVRASNTTPDLSCVLKATRGRTGKRPRATFREQLLEGRAVTENHFLTADIAYTTKIMSNPPSPGHDAIARATLSRHCPTSSATRARPWSSSTAATP